MRPALLLLLLAAPALAADTAGVSSLPALDGVELSVALDPERPTVGDRVSAVLTVEAPAGRLDGAPRFPEWGARWGAAEVFAAHEPEPVSRRDGTAVWRQRVEIAAFRPGRLPLPPVAVEVPLTGRTVTLPTPEQLVLEVASVLPAEPAAVDDGADAPGAAGGGEELTPRPAAPPEPLPWGRRFAWTAGVLSAACLALLLLLWRRGQLGGTAAAPARPRPAPLAELETALGDLSRAPSAEAGHVLLSRAVRRYLGRRLGFPAAESTTTEIHRHLVRRHLPTGAATSLTEVLGACDMVKFARRGDGMALLEQRAAAAGETARRVEHHLVPEPAAASAPADGAAGEAA